MITFLQQLLWLDSLALMPNSGRAKIHLNVVGNGTLKEKIIL